MSHLTNETFVSSSLQLKTWRSVDSGLLIKNWIFISQRIEGAQFISCAHCGIYLAPERPVKLATTWTNLSRSIGLDMCI